MPSLTDVFAPDAFSVYSLTAAIQKVPHQETLISQLGIFRNEPVNTTLVAVEESQGVLTLVPTTHRGGPGIPGQDSKRKVRSFRVPHIQMDDVVYADDVLNVRSFGQTDAMAGVSEVVARKLATMNSSVDNTTEYLRLGALKGTVTYPTNSVDSNLALYTEFETSQQTVNMLLSTSTTKVVETIIPSIKDAIESALGGTPYTNIVALVGRTLFRTLIGHDEVKAVYNQQQALWNLSAVGMVQPNRMFLRVNGIDFYEYYDSTGNIIDADGGYAFPIGPDIYRSIYAPADFVEAAGTMGQPVYARQYPSVDGKSVNLEVQSNGLHICVRPRALIRLNMHNS